MPAGDGPAELPSRGHSKEARGKGKHKTHICRKTCEQGAGQRSMAGEQWDAVLMRLSTAINGTCPSIGSREREEVSLGFSLRGIVGRESWALTVQCFLDSWEVRKVLCLPHFPRQIMRYCILSRKYTALSCNVTKHRFLLFCVYMKPCYLLAGYAGGFCPRIKTAVQWK